MEPPSWIGDDTVDQGFPLEMARSSNLLSKREVEKPTDPDGLVLEAWAQGYMVGSLIIMACITIANMRKGVLLHKLILIELLLGMWHGTFIFNNAPVYGWYLSVTAIGLNMSWSLHNVIAWLKNRPFLSRKVSLIYIWTVVMAQPYWVLEIYANFAYFNNFNDIFLRTRPYEALCRDPWWIFTTVSLFWNIKNRYDFKIIEILRISPRFAVMLMAMCLSIAFLIVDILSVTGVLASATPVGINPFWKLSFVFKCLTDSVILDDFKTALDRLRNYKISHLNSFALRDHDHPSSSNAQRQPRRELTTTDWDNAKETSSHFDSRSRHDLEFGIRESYSGESSRTGNGKSSIRELNRPVGTAV